MPVTKESLSKALRTIQAFDSEIAHYEFSLVVGRALNFIHKRLRIGRVSIALLQNDAGGFRVYDAVTGIQGIESGDFLSFEKTVITEVTKQAKPLYRPEIKKLKTFYEVDKILLQSGFKSYFLIPLISNNQCIGTLNTASKKTDGITQDKRLILELLAPRLAHCLQNVLHIEELEKSRQTYQSLVESVEENHFIYIHNTEGIFTYLSSSVKNILGYTPEELMTHYTQYLTDHPVNQEVVRHSDLSIKGVRQPPYEVEIFHKDGRKRWLEVTEVPVAVPKGTVVAVQGIAHDITKRKKAESEIIKGRDFYLTLFDDFPALIWRSGLDAKCDYFNKTWMDFTGRTLKQELGDGWAEGVHPGDVERSVKIYFDSFQARQPFQMEYRLRHHSGEYRWIVDMGRPFYDLSGIFAGYIGSCYDVTERKTAEHALRKSEERYRKLVDSVTDYIFTVEIKDGQPASTKHGPGCVAVTGYTTEEYDADPYLWYRMVHEEDKESVREHAKKISSGESMQPIEHRIIHKAGTVRWVRNTPVPRYGNEGKLIAYDGLIVDITERKQAEEEVFESEERFRILLERGFDGIFIHENLMIIDLNERMAEMAGYPGSDLLGSNVIDLFPPDSQQRIHEYIRSGRRGVYEVELRRKDGHILQIEAFGANCKYHGRNARIVALRDVSGQKKLQEQLFQAQKMEAVGLLAGGIAHDFNNILTAIIGFSNILKMKMKPDEPLRINIDHILRSAERGANLTQSLLAFSRRQIISPRPVDLNVIIHNVQRILSRVIREDIEMKVVLSGKPLYIMADSVQIEQILMNLATNARDAMPHGGSFFIETGMRIMDDEFITRNGFGVQGEYATLSVTDTGVGMDEKTQDRIFEPFFTTKEVGRGTGLGLAMVYGAVHQNNGYITVYSEPEKGTTFRMYLPLLKSAQSDGSSAGESVFIRGGTETVLVAEDDKALRSLISSILSEFGYTIIEAKDGNEAIRKFNERAEDIKLLIFDVIMPGRNGKEAYEEILKIKSDIKVLFMSGYTADVIHTRDIIEAGLSFLPKPVMPNELLKTVRQILDK
ncbi:MAG: PAS domain S-box protein [Nitrospiraceae bacterium]|nr:MAG: PAS domain S-box protein [Nitrospiraceae bacterium]